MPPLKTSWKKRELQKAEKKSLRLFEQELKEAAQMEREVCACDLRGVHDISHHQACNLLYFFRRERSVQKRIKKEKRRMLKEEKLFRRYDNPHTCTVLL